MSANQTDHNPAPYNEPQSTAAVPVCSMYYDPECWGEYTHYEAPDGEEQ